MNIIFFAVHYTMNTVKQKFWSALFKSNDVAQKLQTITFHMPNSLGWWYGNAHAVFYRQTYIF